MSTTPASPPPQGYERPYYGGALPPVPVPSGELLVFLLVWVVIGIVALAADGRGGVDAWDFVRASVALTIGYMLARGIAKAGRVSEDR
ncbi:MAG: hypothetical protein M3312_08345 [Actinomycetota bacterium]|nr:hypothetical protein [Actinomycetota bacterium]